jgi:peptidoglycan/xylan/chitin deacetylase (PgdA/CDA1 family)
MHPIKSLLLHAYFGATLPARRVAARRRAASGQSPAMVLMYHRVADDRATPWTVSNRIFAEQIAWLRRSFEIVSLDEAQRRVAGGTCDRPCVAITFDDGYRDNAQAAIPLLIREQIPCTYFVSTRMVVESRPFPHDLARGQAFEPNTPDELREWAEAGIEMGGHTRTHADLATIADPSRLWDEVVGGSDELAELVGKPVRWFAFPFGQHRNLSIAAAEIARAAGMSGVCSAYGGYNFPGDDPFHLQRIAVDDDLIRLKNWLTVDPRKFAKHPRFFLPPANVSRLACSASRR